MFEPESNFIKIIKDFIIKTNKKFYICSKFFYLFYFRAPPLLEVRDVTTFLHSTLFFDMLTQLLTFFDSQSALRHLSHDSAGLPLPLLPLTTSPNRIFFGIRCSFILLTCPAHFILLSLMSSDIGLELVIL